MRQDCLIDSRQSDFLKVGRYASNTPSAIIILTAAANGLDNVAFAGYVDTFVASLQVKDVFAARTKTAGAACEIADCFSSCHVAPHLLGWIGVVW